MMPGGSARYKVLFDWRSWGRSTDGLARIEPLTQFGERSSSAGFVPDIQPDSGLRVEHGKSVGQ
jgi:hypothetical protein